MKRRDKGITLIALIVTIIILLILAGVTINLVTGQNGIINRAKATKEITTGAQDLEKINMCIMASYDESGILPTRNDDKSAGYDFYTTKDVIIYPKQATKVITNIN